MQACQLSYSIKQKKTVRLMVEHIKIYCLPRKMASNIQTNSNRDFHQKKKIALESVNLGQITCGSSVCALYRHKNHFWIKFELNNKISIFIPS